MDKRLLMEGKLVIHGQQACFQTPSGMFAPAESCCISSKQGTAASGEENEVVCNPAEERVEEVIWHPHSFTCQPRARPSSLVFIYPFMIKDLSGFWISHYNCS